MNGVSEIFFPHVPDGLTGHPLGLHVAFGFHQGVVENINIFAARTPSYALQPILATYGPPDEVWLQTQPYTPGGDVIFRISLLYLEEGFSAHITTDEAYLQDRDVIGCFSVEAPQGTSLFLWLPSTYTSFPTIVQHGRFGQEASSYLPLEEATGMDVMTFYDRFKDSEGEACLSTPAEIWRD